MLQFCHQDNSTYWNAISTVQENVKQEFHQLWSKYAPAYLTDLVEHEWQRHGSCALPAVCSIKYFNSFQPMIFFHALTISESSNPRPMRVIA